MTNSLSIPAPRVEGGLSVRPATLGDVPFMDRLQKWQTKALGFFPTGQFAGYIEMGGILIAESASGPVGYIISRDRYQKRDELGIVYQLNVEPTVQRGYVGAALLKAAFERSAYGCRLYCCWCAQDLPANKFWEAMGFVPLAFRAGSAKKKVKGGGGGGRVHIFWQKRINDGDVSTPWWYPFQTTGGAMRADRLAFPIPPGTHWSEVTAVAVPTVGGEDGGGVKALPAKRVRKKKAEASLPPVAVVPQVVRTRVVMGGKVKYLEQPVDGDSWGAAPVPSTPAVVETTALAPVEPIKKKVATAGPKIDPLFLKANRELRDRYLERVAEEPWMLEATGKYDLARLPTATPLDGRRGLASREVLALPAAA